MHPAAPPQEPGRGRARWGRGRREGAGSERPSRPASREAGAPGQGRGRDRPQLTAPRPRPLLRGAESSGGVAVPEQSLVRSLAAFVLPH